MKKKLNLFKLSEREGRQVKGGYEGCWCACAYVNCGGSSSNDNWDANLGGNKKSPDFKPVC